MNEQARISQDILREGFTSLEQASAMGASPQDGVMGACKVVWDC